jgi:pyruvate,water dikinase
MKARDNDALSSSELVSALEVDLDSAAEVCRYTMAVLSDFRRPAFDLLDFCEQELGPDGARLAAATLQGTDNASANAGTAMARLAQSAAASPVVSRILVEGRFNELAEAEEAQEFLRDLRHFLDAFGWRPQDAGSIHLPTWAEEPTPALKLLASYIGDTEVSPAAAIARSKKQRDEATREVMERLSPGRQERFNELLEAGSQMVPINENRNFWQLTSVGLLRLPALALGRKLVAQGALAEAKDVFFLYLEELSEAGAATSSLRDLVAHRKVDFERWHDLTPPPFIGRAPEDNAAARQAPGARYVRYASDGEAAHLHEGDIIKGIGASRGQVTGTARIIRGLEEADRLQPGEILVCVATSPPWTPLFSLAGAVVTDTGGILSHSAICAREYGIPCVVGTGVATSRIADGAVVIVDGAAGTVTVTAHENVESQMAPS